MLTGIIARDCGRKTPRRNTSSREAIRGLVCECLLPADDHSQTSDFHISL